MVKVLGESLSRIVLRTTLGAVFLWFGVDKFVNPAYWIMWTPQTVEFIVQDFLLDFIVGLGVFEVFVAAVLFSGKFTRIVGAVAAVFLATVILTSDVTTVVRDIGLFGAATALALGDEK